MEAQAAQARMVSDPPCPICGAEKWEAHNRYVFERGDQSGLNAYELLRRRVLFEVWRPAAEQVVMSAALCASCGFVTTLPRPTDALIDAKYRFLAEEENSVGGTAESKLGRRMDERRAERGFQALAAELDLSQARVLDFGGGDGKLLRPFVEAGADCWVVDYNDKPIAGVSRLGATLDDVADDEMFDAIVCSHVLEHVAEPRETLTELRRHLREDGALYAEVPVEVWRGIPVARDPVTHVNFFTLGSLEQLVSRSGYAISTSSEFRGSYAEVVIDVAAVVATHGSGGGQVADPVAAAARLLDPQPQDWARHSAQLAERVGRQVDAVVRSGSAPAAAKALLSRVGARVPGLGRLLGPRP